MQLVILHHHLNRGGVTQVMVNHLRALATLPPNRQPERVVILYDGQHDGWPDAPLAGSKAFPVELVVLPAMGYDPPGATVDAEELAKSITGALRSLGLSPTNALLHTHNHSLGKNASLPGALARLAEAGWRQLLQVHDFAEDNRPANYCHLVKALGAEGISKQLYPQAMHVHYATLTERDAAVLRLGGVPNERLHTLPNPAAEFDELPSREEARKRVLPALSLPPTTKLFVYPVRGIRRKNLGEMLLLSAIAPEGSAFAVTLAPKDPVERASFDRWQTLAEKIGLPCRFDTAGAGVEFIDALAAADAILTTSIAEGFGMVFLESQLVERSLMGRDLPEITTEFRKAGMTFTGLHEQVLVPLETIGTKAVRASLAAMHRETCQGFGAQPLTDADLASEIEHLTMDGVIDFARLTTDQQATLIEQVVRDPAVRKQVRQSMAGLATQLAGEIDFGDEIQANAQVVRDVYSPSTIGQRLACVYDTIMASPIQEAPAIENSDALLQHFLHPKRLHAVRLEGG